MSNSNHRAVVHAFAAFLLVATSFGISLPSGPRTLVQLGQIAPATAGGVFSSLGPPSINGLGDVVFAASLSKSSVRNGIFMVRYSGLISQIALFGQEAPGTQSRFTNFGHTNINDLGQIAFAARIGAGLDNQGIFFYSGNQIVRQIAITGQDVPGTDAKFTHLGEFGVGMDNAGRVVFEGTFGNGGDGIFRFENDRVEPLVLAGQAAPGDPDIRFARFRDLSVNDNGNIAFVASLYGGSSNFGVFSIADRNIKVIALQGHSAPYEDAPFFGEFRDPSISKDGIVAFVDSAPGPFPSKKGFSVTRAVIICDVIPLLLAEANHRIRSEWPQLIGNFHKPQALARSNGRLTFFQAWSTQRGNNAFFLVQNDSLTELLREGDHTPLGGTYSFIGNARLGNSGHLAFVSNLKGAASKAAIFVLKLQ